MRAGVIPWLATWLQTIESTTGNDNVDGSLNCAATLQDGEPSLMTNSPKSDRKAWRKPQLKSIEAGSAEAGSGGKGDSGAGKRS